jgi:hypothetical protein
VHLTHRRTREEKTPQTLDLDDVARAESVNEFETPGG